MSDSGRSRTVVTAISKISERPATSSACLVVIYGLDLGRKYNLVRPQIVIGRSSRADICVDQEAVSRNHCKIINTGNAIMTHDVLDRLKEISSPTILLCGAEDVITPPRHAEEMGRRLPRADVHIIPRSAHGFLSEHPASFDLITGFFSRH